MTLVLSDPPLQREFKAAIRLSDRDGKRPKAECKDEQRDERDDDAPCAKRLHRSWLGMSDAQHHSQ